MKLDIANQLQKVTVLAKKYIVIIVALIFGIMYGFLILASSQQAQNKPPEGMVLDQVNAAERPSIDESAAATLKQLRDQNIEVKALFEEARNNPFSE
jgi:Tfp pilus assembly protein PilO